MSAIEHSELASPTPVSNKAPVEEPSAAFTPPEPDTTRPTLTGSFGMAASTHWLGTATAQSVLERGGNAIDAAMAGAFVLHIVEPHLNGPGGELVAIVSPAAGTSQVVVGQGPAPAGATIDHYRSEGLTEVPGAGALAAAVPGAVEAWLRLLAEYGTWTVRDVLSYAIHYAREGHTAGVRLCQVIDTMRDLFVSDWPTSAEQWLVKGAAPVPGSLVGNRAYANTLERLVEIAESAGSDRLAQIARFGDEWRRGFVARAVVDFAGTPHRHSTGGVHAGVIGMDDFASFEPTLEAPVRASFRGTTVAKAGFWTQGPVLLQTLGILETFDDCHLDPSTALGAHTILEALKLAFADRDSYYGDAVDGSLPPEALLSREYARRRAAQITDTASTEISPGVIPGFVPFLPPAPHWQSAEALPSDTRGAGEPTVTESGITQGDTCHIDVVDRHGNMISATPSGGWLQSSPTVPGLGICLGTRLQMTWLDPESPSALRPCRRPRTTLTPTVLEREGRAVAALGSPGGDQQDQWQLLYLLRTIVGGYSPQEAIDAPAFHTLNVVASFWPRTWQPGVVVVESRLGSAVIEELERRGHTVRVEPPWSLGRLSVVTRDAGTGVLSAAANPRGAQGYAAGR